MHIHGDSVILGLINMISDIITFTVTIVIDRLQFRKYFSSA